MTLAPIGDLLRSRRLTIDRPVSARRTGGGRIDNPGRPATRRLIRWGYGERFTGRSVRSADLSFRAKTTPDSSPGADPAGKPVLVRHSGLRVKLLPERGPTGPGRLRRTARGRRQGNGRQACPSRIARATSTAPRATNSTLTSMISGLVMRFVGRFANTFWSSSALAAG